ncbi:DeoR/GlpR family DNA-binding transcription regulator [Viridibacillus arvi]|uniref:DeoR/GlpR family DNA-binding transcription regulator n=1 Tax=Viridibacillus arvi TaxID=263475 RepID=UPI003820508E
MSKVKHVRIQMIEELLKTNKKVFVKELSEYLRVSPETIRRDLDELAQMKLVNRFHGGATLYKKVEKEPVFEQKLQSNSIAKKRIAKEAATRIENGDIIAVDVGSTTVHLASYISGKDITIVTNSIVAADAFSKALERQQFTGKIILLGGYTNPTQRSVHGALTLNLIDNFQFNKSFISCGGLLEQGIYDFDLDETLVSAKMIRNAQQAILLVDGSKVNISSLVKFGDVIDIHEIISDVVYPSKWNRYKYIWTKVQV